MNREDIKKVLFILETNYPNTYKSMTNEQKIRQIDNYLDFFGEYETTVVVAALKNYIKNNEFPPTVAGLTKQINILLIGGTDIEDWNLIRKACNNGSYGSVSEFNKLPEVCQKWLGTPQTLKDMSIIEPQTLDTVVKGEFLKSIGQVKERDQAFAGLPNEVRKAIASAKTLQIETEALLLKNNR